MSTTQDRNEKMAPILDRIPREWGKYLPLWGWDELLLELDAKLAALHPDYTIFQAKEKFGGLRFYAGVGVERDTHEDFNKLIHEAEEKSWHICEMCGQPGERREGGWIKVLCDEHAKPKVTAPTSDAEKAWEDIETSGPLTEEDRNAQE